MTKLSILGVRQQLNLQTALVDASQIYGANKEEMDFLTDLSTGISYLATRL